MSRLYSDAHWKLQAEFGTTELADRVESAALRFKVTDRVAAFIESRDMFFLSSVDDRGRPTVSYKGGTRAS